MQNTPATIKNFNTLCSIKKCSFEFDFQRKTKEKNQNHKTKIEIDVHIAHVISIRLKYKWENSKEVKAVMICLESLSL